MVVVFTPSAMGLRRCAVERPFGIIQFRISNIGADGGHAFHTTSLSIAPGLVAERPTPPCSHASAEALQSPLSPRGPAS